MKTRFELFHLSLIPRKQGELFDSVFKDFTREQWLRKVFTEAVVFVGTETTMEYIDYPAHSSDDAIVGGIGREHEKNENKPPNEGFASTTRIAWHAAVIVIDPRHHEQGQRISIQNDKMVGNPRGISERLVHAINQKYPAGPYIIEVAPIFNADDFWKWAEEHKNQVTSVTFEFIAPNMFGSDDDLEKELRDLRDNTGMQTMKTEIKGEPLKIDSEPVRRGAKYAALGGGTIKARAKGNKRFNSKERIKKIEIYDVVTELDDMMARIAELRKKVLGNE